MKNSIVLKKQRVFLNPLEDNIGEKGGQREDFKHDTCRYKINYT